MSWLPDNMHEPQTGSYFKYNGQKINGLFDGV